MTQSAEHLAKAEAALDMVKDDAGLMQWHDEFMSDDHYASMLDDDARALERLYQSAHVRVNYPGALVG